MVIIVSPLMVGKRTCDYHYDTIIVQVFHYCTHHMFPYYPHRVCTVNKTPLCTAEIAPRSTPTKGIRIACAAEAAKARQFGLQRVQNLECMCMCVDKYLYIYI